MKSWCRRIQSEGKGHKIRRMLLFGELCRWNEMESSSPKINSKISEVVYAQ